MTTAKEIIGIYIKGSEIGTTFTIDAMSTKFNYAYSTVRVVMNRLHQQGYLARERVGLNYVYTLI